MTLRRRTVPGVSRSSSARVDREGEKPARTQEGIDGERRVGAARPRLDPQAAVPLVSDISANRRHGPADLSVIRCAWQESECLDVGGTYDGKVPPVECGDFACAESFGGGDNASAVTAQRLIPELDGLSPMCRRQALPKGRRTTGRASGSAAGTCPDYQASDGGSAGGSSPGAASLMVSSSGWSSSGRALASARTARSSSGRSSSTVACKIA